MNDLQEVLIVLSNWTEALHNAAWRPSYNMRMLPLIAALLVFGVSVRLQEPLLEVFLSFDWWILIRPVGASDGDIIVCLSKESDWLTWLAPNTVLLRNQHSVRLWCSYIGIGTHPSLRSSDTHVATPSNHLCKTTFNTYTHTHTPTHSPTHSHTLTHSQ